MYRVFEHSQVVLTWFSMHVCDTKLLCNLTSCIVTIRIDYCVINFNWNPQLLSCQPNNCSEIVRRAPFPFSRRVNRRPSVLFEQGKERIWVIAAHSVSNRATSSWITSIKWEEREREQGCKRGKRNSGQVFSDSGCVVIVWFSARGGATGQMKGDR